MMGRMCYSSWHIWIYCIKPRRRSRQWDERLILNTNRLQLWVNIILNLDIETIKRHLTYFLCLLHRNSHGISILQFYFSPLLLSHSLRTHAEASLKRISKKFSAILAIYTHDHEQLTNLRKFSISSSQSHSSSINISSSLLLKMLFRKFIHNFSKTSKLKCNKCVNLRRSLWVL